MANRFVRTIRDVKDVHKTPLFTNEQNDLISDVDNRVYVRTGSQYVRITGLKDLETQVDKIKTLIPKSEENLKYINELENSIDQLKTRLDTLELKDNDDHDKFVQNDQSIQQLQADIKDVNDKIQKLEDINLDKYVTRGELQDIQSTFENIKDIDFTNFAKKDDIPQIPDLSDYVKKEDTNNWQKYDLTNKNGTLKHVQKVDFNEPENTLENGGMFYVQQCVNQPKNEQPYGNVIYQKRISEDNSHEKIYFTPYNNNNQYIRTKTSGVWSDWVLLNPETKDTGWVGLHINNEFKPERAKNEYRIIEHKDIKQVYLNINITSLKKGKNIIGKLPKNLLPYFITGVGCRMFNHKNNLISVNIYNTTGDIAFNTTQDFDESEENENEIYIYQTNWIV